MTREEAIARLEANRGAFVFKETNEALDMAIEALNHSVFPNSSLISRQDALDILDDFEADVELGERDSYKVYREKLLSLASRITEYKTFCGVPIEEATRIVQEHKADPLCALADRECPFQGKEFAWCLTCPHISEEDRKLVRKAVEGSQPKTGEWIRTGNTLKCPFCGATGEDIKDDYCFNYCPNCGAKMGGDDSE